MLDDLGSILCGAESWRINGAYSHAGAERLHEWEPSLVLAASGGEVLGVSGAAFSRRSAGQFKEVDQRGEKATEDEKPVQSAIVTEPVVVRSWTEGPAQLLAQHRAGIRTSRGGGLPLRSERETGGRTQAVRPRIAARAPGAMRHVDRSGSGDQYDDSFGYRSHGRHRRGGRVSRARRRRGVRETWRGGFAAHSGLSFAEA